MYESLKATSFVSTSTPSTSLPFDEVAMTFPPSLNSNSNCSLARSLPTNSLVALMTASAGVALYLFVNLRVESASLTVATSLPSPLSATETWIVWLSVEYSTPATDPAFSVNTYSCSPGSVYESLKATSFVATSTPSTSLPFDDVAMTFPPSLNSNSNCSLASSLPTNSLVALITASAGVALYVFVNLRASSASVTVATSLPSPLSTTLT